MKRLIIPVLFMTALNLAYASEKVGEEQQLELKMATARPSPEVTQAIIVAPPPLVWNTDRELDGIHAIVIVGWPEK